MQVEGGTQDFVVPALAASSRIGCMEDWVGGTSRRRRRGANGFVGSSANGRPRHRLDRRPLVQCSHEHLDDNHTIHT